MTTTVSRRGRTAFKDFETVDVGNGFFVNIGRPPGNPHSRERVVLLVHGASASSSTFTVPDGGLVKFLQAAKFRVFTLDWRSSKHTVDELVAPASGSKGADRNGFTLDQAVSDLEAGVRTVADMADVDQQDIAIVGHCVGGALVAQAIAEGRCKPTRRVVLTTLSLFFRVGMEGWFKGNDYVLEDLHTTTSETEMVISAAVALSDRLRWPSALEERYRFWADSGLPHGCDNEFCKRASFMYGMPFRVDDMRYLHDGEEGGLEGQFGSMPLGIYVHCLRNLRRGWAAPFDGDSPTEFLEKGARENFNDKRVTLITGNENQVWHRDGMDRMYEWLIRGTSVKEREAFTKQVLPGYGHQDLFWSTKAKDDVYPKILAGISP